METLIQTFAGSPIIYAAVFIPVSVAVLALLMAFRYMFSARTDVVKDRLDRTVRGSTVVTQRPSVLRGSDQRSFFQSALSPLAKVAKPTDAEELGRLRASLSHAGFRSERAMILYLASKVFLCLLLGGGFLWFNAYRPQPIQNAAFLTLLLMTVGLYFPNLWLMSRVQERKGNINRSLPDAIDLMVTCVEAGLGLDAAMNRVSDEITLSSPLLAAEMNQASLEMRAGVPRGEAFRRLADRTGVDELRSLAAIIVQTELFGTSVAKSLRVQADGLRIRRMQLAEERAASVAVKLTIPLVLCILPALFVVLMGPAVINIFRILLPSLGGNR